MATVAQLGSHLRVRKESVDLDKVQYDLWIQNLAYSKKKSLGYKLKTTDYSGIQLWEEDGDWIVLPRGYFPPFIRICPGCRDHGKCLFPNPCVRVEDIRPKWDLLPGLTFRKGLRKDQEAAALSLVHTEGDKQLCLGCGKGKTAIFLWYASIRSMKTLIIVDRDFLVDQWLREIKKFLWIPMEEVGLVQGSTRKIGKHFTIGLVHTITQQEFDKEFFDSFGLVGVDECHMLGAPTFSNVLPNFSGERVLLSATPSRKDGLSPVFLYHGGGLSSCFVDLTRTQSSSWFFLKLPPILSPKEEKSCKRRLPNGSYIIHRPIYESKAAKSLVFNKFIVDEVMKAAATGRNVLVLGSRVEQLQVLAEVVGEHYECGLVTGVIKGDNRRAAFGKQILFITDKIGSRALDVPRLDTLFLLYPNHDSDFLRQTVGRIDREIAGKRNPLVVVFGHTMLEKSVNKMAAAIREVDSEATITEIQRG